MSIHNYDTYRWVAMQKGFIFSLFDDVCVILKGQDLKKLHH